MPSEVDPHARTMPEGLPDAPERSQTETLVIRLEGRKHSIGYRSGDTILGAARRAGIGPPSSCEQGNCGTCMARLEEGRATMRENNVLGPDDLEEGWVLTCQAVPQSREVVVDYDA